MATALFGMTKTPSQTVWITRTQPSASQTAAAFKRAGFGVITAPLLTVEPETHIAPLPERAVLIFTSQNGVRAFCSSHAARNYPVVTVGDATAELARRLGFSNTRSAGGTSDDIAPLIAQSPDKQAQYLHISGNHVRGAVSQDLAAMGLKSERCIYYRSAPVQAMPDINLSEVDIAAFFSPLAAQTLALLSPQTCHLKAVSISAATDDALGTLKFKERRIARAPTLKSLIAALGEAG